MKSRIIEIIGPPGIGKTTIYDALCKTWRSQAPWIYPEALYIQELQHPSLLNRITYGLKKAAGKKISKSIPVEYGLRFAEQYWELANFYWNYLSNPSVYPDEEINKRFRSVHFLYSDFCKYQVIAESNHKKLCIVNEGLLQKSFFIHDDEMFMRDVIERYIPLLPLPGAVFFINTYDRELIVERLMARKKIIASHIGKNKGQLLDDTERWQHLLHFILSKMHALNVPVFTIDAGKTVKENVNYINQVLVRLADSFPAPAHLVQTEKSNKVAG